MRSPFLQRLADLPDVLPIFPLSGAVVLPGVQLPLNIFEPRYLALVQAALASDHLIGMVQPRGPAEDEQLEIHRVGCAGRITSYSETNDGRIIVVLTGLCRFKVVQELPMQDGFRRIKPDWQAFTLDLEDDEAGLDERDRFMGSLRAFCDRRSVEIPWDDVSNMADTDLVNLLCTHLPLDAEDKQALLETAPLGERATLMRGLMDMSAHASGLGTEHRH
ncbi:peptidase S16 [Lamprobacter modestohalophilus]|uniref:Peptidase S16 n=1 Tax=Lamprobacter modestohalophilus TaxID=1064514 RepID=A0A9X1B3X4_9GAMM|nr:LON peptidase substrate-binding domain-containing protein [Lamprobacter modestohalophilus]MBK1618870.1 peptidase S16 [Lamprobacter modestohalophilus]MCF7978553.1 LON peptidase substrate-binding domain-containing protein [Chromatiaceae bacterium]